MDLVQAEDKRFTKISWFVLAFCAILILLDVIQTIYRFQVPTDGWSWHTGAIGSQDEQTVFYDANLVGDPSPLQPGDQVNEVVGIPIADGSFTQIASAATRLAGIHAGDLVEYTLRRGDQVIQVNVPMTRWTLAAAARYFLSPVSLIFNLASYLMLGIGLFTFLKRPQLPSARALLVWCTAIFCIGVSGTLPDNLYNFLFPLAYLGMLFTYLTFVLLMAPSMLAFTMVFPRPKGIVRRRPWLPLVPFLIGLGVSAVILIDSRLTALGWLGTLLLSLLAAANLIHSAFTQKDAVSRAQLRWAVGGVVVGILIFILTFLPAFGLVNGPIADILESSIALGFIIIGVSLAIALLRYRLWDIDLIINRTLVYLPLTAILAGLYSASIALFQKIFVSVTGSKSDAALVLTTFILVTTFTPIKTWLQNWVDKHFKETRDPIKAIHSLDHQVRAIADVLDAQSITGRLLDTAISAFRSAGGAVYLEQGGEMILAHATPQWQMEAAKISLPMAWNHRIFGALYLMEREAGLEYNTEDRSALQQAVNQVARIMATFMVEPLSLLAPQPLVGRSDAPADSLLGPTVPR